MNAIEPEAKIDKERDSRLISVREMSPNDYNVFQELAQDAWPGIVPNTEHDFVALTDHGISIAAWEGQSLLGASLNMVRPSETPGEFHILVHMIGVMENARGKGTGKKLMKRIYQMVTTDELGSSVTEVRLTSDPLESQNVLFYLHHNRMHVNLYKFDAYKSFAKAGGEQHRGVPADRFLYTSHPKSAWVERGILPTPEEYGDYIARNRARVIPISVLPDTITIEKNPSVVFVEVLPDLKESKKKAMDLVRLWQAFNQSLYPRLFSSQHGYQAVDAVTFSLDGQPRTFAVLLRGFDEQNEHCLHDAVINP